MPTFQPGDIVDITIKGARVTEQVEPGALDFDLYGWPMRIRPALEGVTVERVAPAEWPPMPGDLWRDKHGELWFVYTNPVDKAGALHGRTTGGKRWTDDAHLLIAGNAPLTLVYRES